MTDHAVVIAGGGPTGMMLAGELALAGVDAVIVERRLDQHVDGSRAGGLVARTLEVLDQRGIADRFIAAGQVMQVQPFAGALLDIGDFPSRHACTLALWQSRFEPILADWIADLGVTTIRGREVVGFTQDDAGVDVELSDGSSMRSAYLVGCDGGRSVVRKAAGIDFVGVDASTSWMIAKVEMADQPEIGMRPEGGGIGPVDRTATGGPYRVVLVERGPITDRTADDPSLDDLRAALVESYGTDFRVHSPTWISRFTDMARQAAAYRDRRVLLAGDAAHVHSPHGGQGLNTGVQDAVNLGWKLAQVVRGTSPDSLLDTYHAERHPVGARVLRNTMAQVALAGTDERHLALREMLTGLLATDDARRQIVGMISGLDIHYDLGGAHPLVGRRMPDLDLTTTDGPTRLFTLLHEARPLLLDLGDTDPVDLTRWTDRVRFVQAVASPAPWQLPVLGDIPAPPAVLIRPDGHVAWAGDPCDADFAAALSWFGSAD